MSSPSNNGYLREIRRLGRAFRRDRVALVRLRDCEKRIAAEAAALRKAESFELHRSAAALLQVRVDKIDARSRRSIAQVIARLSQRLTTTT